MTKCLDGVSISLCEYTNGLRMCYCICESVNRQFLTLRNSVIKDSTIFGRHVIPVSIRVVKEIGSWADLLIHCGKPAELILFEDTLRD